LRGSSALLRAPSSPEKPEAASPRPVGRDAAKELRFGVWSAGWSCEVAFEVVVRSVEPARVRAVEDIFEFIRSLPRGTRTKEDIDGQIAEERDSWGER
jgi:hypothetical protein